MDGALTIGNLNGAGRRWVRNAIPNVAGSTGIWSVKPCPAR